MTDYFIHFINIPLHLFYGNGMCPIDHRSDFTDKVTDSRDFHARFLRNPVEGTFIIRHLLHVNLDFPSQLLGKVKVFLRTKSAWSFF